MEQQKETGVAGPWEDEAGQGAGLRPCVHFKHGNDLTCFRFLQGYSGCCVEMQRRRGTERGCSDILRSSGSFQGRVAETSRKASYPVGNEELVMTVAVI